MRQILKAIVWVMDFVPKSKDILLIETHAPSGSNTNAIAKGLERNKISFTMVNYPVRQTEKMLNYKFKLFLFHLKVSRYKVVINTNGYKKISNKQVLIDYWHGVPMKSMLFMQDRKIAVNSKNLFNCDYLITSSKIESTLMASCTFIPFYKHKIIGSPRLDFLEDYYEIKNYLNITDELVIDKDTKFIIYMPTFRQSSSHGVDSIIYDNLFNLSSFNDSEFEKFLVENNLVLIVKMHPLDIKNIKLFRNTVTLNEDKLIKHDLDLYQLLSSTSMLISDYSSIVYDYSLLNKPIIMINNDINSYSENRGFLYNDLNLLVKSCIVNEESSLIQHIKELLGNTPSEIKAECVHEITSDNTQRSIEWILNEVLEKEI